ncbi:MAG: class I SAM-dependent methyltransferase [Thermoplasmata archaeon]|nr:MAG: class I SAM-dependent methyltransferase [Thermoplasmata archaeon]
MNSLQEQKNVKEDVLQGYANLFRDDILISYSLAYYFHKMKTTIDGMVAQELESRDRNRLVNIMDMGCNRGYDVFRMNRKFPNRKISLVGLDISPVDIQYASDFAKDHDLKNCDFVVGSAEATKYKNESFDIVVCSELLEHVPQPEKVLKEIHRILRRGGCAIISTPNAENRLSSLRKFAPKKLKQGWNRPPTVEDKDKGNYERLAREGFVNLPHISEKGIKEWIRISEGIGFTVEDVRRGSLMWGHEFFDEHPGLTGLLLFLDSILDKITYDFSSDFAAKMRK